MTKRQRMPQGTLNTFLSNFQLPSWPRQPFSALIRVILILQFGIPDKSSLILGSQRV